MEGNINQPWNHTPIAKGNLKYSALLYVPGFNKTKGLNYQIKTFAGQSSETKCLYTQANQFQNGTRNYQLRRDFAEGASDKRWVI